MVDFIGVDIGNSRVKYALISGGDIRRVGEFHFPYGTDRSILVSVVPDKNEQVVRDLKIRGIRETIFLSEKNIPHIGKVSGIDMSKVGMDRIAAVIGALSEYKPPVLIADFGTALTFDYLNESGIYEGGLILNGIENSIVSLAERCALIPKDIAPERFSDIGLTAVDTEGAVISGAVLGYAGIFNAMVKDFSRKSLKPLTVVVTGGAFRYVENFADGDFIYDVNLIFRGIRVAGEYIYEKGKM